MYPLVCIPTTTETDRQENRVVAYHILPIKDNEGMNVGNKFQHALVSLELLTVA